MQTHGVLLQMLGIGLYFLCQLCVLMSSLWSTFESSYSSLITGNHSFSDIQALRGEYINPYQKQPDIWSGIPVETFRAALMEYEYREDPCRPVCSHEMGQNKMV